LKIRHKSPASQDSSLLLYVQLIWAMMLGWIVFGQLPFQPSTIGLLIISASAWDRA